MGAAVNKKRKRDEPDTALKTVKNFSLRDICGKWKSNFNSPDIRIFHDGKRFRLTLQYRQGIAFTFIIRSVKGITFFDFYGRIHICYNQEYDTLLLDNEGIYQRAYDEA